MKHLAGLNVLILGLGDSGLGMARWCALQGALVRVWDSRETPPHGATLRQEQPGIQILSGDLAPEQLGPARLVLKSPGLAPGDARIAPLLEAARQTGIAVAGELDLFARALADLAHERRYAPQVIAITGTNGKTTTASMCAQFVARCGLRVALAGNIGPTMLDTLADALAREPEPIADTEALDAGADGEATLNLAVAGDAQGQVTRAADASEADASDDGQAQVSPALRVDIHTDTDTDTGRDHQDPDVDPRAPVIAAPPPRLPVFQVLPEVWVLELSSFQLHGASGFEPSAATVLNLTEDHLDWHGSLQAYSDDKARIFGEQAVMVINRDDPRVEAMVPAPTVIKGGRGQRSRTVARKVVRFGLDAPEHPGDFGLVDEQGMAWLVRAHEADDTPVKGRARREAEDDPVVLQRLMPADALRVRGRHNAANALAALALATAVGCPLAPMLHGLREYAGEPHRVAFVGTVEGIDAYDDSKGTNVGATVAALDGLGADQAPARLLVLLGGDGKGQDFAPLVAPLLRHARAVAVIGRDGPKIAETVGPALAEARIALQRHDTLEAAVGWCFDQGEPGDALLLSPACASLDMFRNYAHRADVFVAAVQARAAEQGVML